MKTKILVFIFFTSLTGVSQSYNLPDTTLNKLSILGDGSEKALINFGYQKYAESESLPTIESYLLNEYTGKTNTPLLINPYVNGEMAIGTKFSQWLFNNTLTINDGNSVVKNKILVMSKPGGTPNNAATMFFDVLNGVNIWGATGQKFAIGDDIVTVGIGTTNPNTNVSLDVNGKIRSQALSGTSDDFVTASADGIMVRPTGDKLVKMMKSPVSQIVKPMAEDISVLMREIQSLKEQITIINKVNESLRDEIQKLSSQNLSEAPKIYPNPFDNQTTIQLPNGVKATASVFTAKGEKISQSEKFEGKIILPLNNMSPGQYYFVLKGIKL